MNPLELLEELSQECNDLVKHGMAGIVRERLQKAFDLGRREQAEKDKTALIEVRRAMDGMVYIQEDEMMLGALAAVAPDEGKDNK